MKIIIFIQKKNTNTLLLFIMCSSNARFLWKRIPAAIKQKDAELEKIWLVYNHLWNNDMPGFFKAISYEWSTNVAELMFELKGTLNF